MDSPDSVSIDNFKQIKRRVRDALIRAFEQAAFAFYYPNADVTITIRSGKYIRVDVRESDPIQ